MRSTRRWGEVLECLPAPVLAVLITKGLVDEWPIEITRRGRAYTRAPDVNVWRLAIQGDGRGVLECLMTVEEVSARQEE